jgi:hypothetical protein
MHCLIECRPYFITKLFILGSLFITCYSSKNQSTPQTVHIVFTVYSTLYCYSRLKVKDDTEK